MIYSHSDYLKRDGHPQIDALILHIPSEIVGLILRRIPTLESILALKHTSIRANRIVAKELVQIPEKINPILERLLACESDNDFHLQLQNFPLNTAPVSLTVNENLPRLSRLQNTFQRVVSLHLGPMIRFDETLLPRLPHLQSLCIASFADTARPLQITSLVSQSLERVEMNGNQPVDDISLATLSSQLPKLTWLKLEHCEKVTKVPVANYHLQGMRHTAQTASKLLNQDELYLNGCQELTSIALSSAPYSATLRVALLSGTKLDDLGLTHLCNVSPALITLDLTDCLQLSCDVFVTVQWPKSLQNIKLDGTIIDDRGLERLLNSCPYITFLSIERCGAISRQILSMKLPTGIVKLASPTIRTPLEIFEQLSKEIALNALGHTEHAFVRWNSKKNLESLARTRDSLQQALQLAPTFLPALKFLAQLSRNEEKLELLEKIVCLEPNNAVNLSQLANQLSTKNEARAEHLFKKVLHEIDPGNMQANLGLAALLVENRPKQAKSLLQIVLAKQHDNPLAIKLLEEVH